MKPGRFSGRASCCPVLSGGRAHSAPVRRIGGRGPHRPALSTIAVALARRRDERWSTCRMTRLRTLVSRAACRIRSAVDAGMSTAEYAVGTVAAVAFAVVLYKIVRSDAVSSALSSIVRSALHAI
jgi:hypothetical protein